MRTHGAAARRFGATALALALTMAAAVLFADPAGAAIVPTVPLGTSVNYSVLAGETVTNTGPSVLNKSLGLWSGTSITGFPPGTVLGTTDQTNGAAQTAKSNLTTAYLNAAGRPVNVETTADLSGLTLNGGVYSAASKGALGLTGTLILDGEGNSSSVFIFQTDSSLTIGSSSVVRMINGATACNVFWQVGSSATLDTTARFSGNILALSSISVNNAATIHGRLLARNGAVTLINDTFTTPTCAGETSSTPTTPVTTPGGGTTVPADTTGSGTGTGIDTGLGSGPGTPVSGPPRTGGAPLQTGGGFPWVPILFVALALSAGTTDLVLTRRHRAHELARAGATDAPASS
jgi:Ice-binding-like